MKRLVLVTALLACAGGQKPATVAAAQPPVAARVPHPVELHGDTLQDDYAWLREKGTPQVVQYLSAENAYADAFMKPTAASSRRSTTRCSARIKETDVDVPYREGGCCYYSRTEKGKQYPIYCRQEGHRSTAPEQVLLDVNELAEGQEVHVALGDCDSRATTATCSPTPPTTPASASTRCTSRTCAPARPAPTRSTRVD